MKGKCLYCGKETERQMFCNDNKTGEQQNRIFMCGECD